MLKKMGWCLLTGSLLTPGLMAQEKPRELPGAEPIRPPAPLVPSNELPPLFVDTQVSQGSTYVDKWSFSADYLWWWMKRAPSPAPYVTTTRVQGEGIPQEFAGSLGDPDTQSLVDDRNLNFGTFSGLRLRASAMGPLVGLDLGGFLLERRSGGDFIAADMPSSPTGTDGGFPFLARPFFDVNANRENAYFISVPTFTSGSTRVSEQVSIFGYDVNATMRLACWDNVEIIGFVGHRFLGLNENLEFNDRIVSLADQLAEVAIFYDGQPVFRNGVVSITDSFRTSNRFYGGQLGSQTRVTLSDLLSLSFRGSVALGVNQQLAEVQGVTSLKPAPTDPDQTSRSTVGGIYAQPTNIGSYFRSVFSYASEGEVNLEYAITPNLTARAGYSIVYWANVVRPGNLIDRRVDRRSVPSDPSYTPTPVPPVEVPVFAFKNSDIWVQGLTFGLELHY